MSVNVTSTVPTSAANTVLTNVTNTISANITSTVPINSDDKKGRYKMDRYILHPVLLVIILLFMIVIIGYHYAKHRSKQKNIEKPAI